MNDTGIRQEVIEEIRKLAVINPQIILKNENNILYGACESRADSGISVF